MNNFIKVGENMVNLNNIAYIAKDDISDDKSVIHFIGGSKLKLPTSIINAFAKKLESGLT